MWTRSLCRLVPLLLAFGFAAAAPAVIIDSGDGTGNTTAPSPDPGFGHVGVCSGLTAVYLGDGWVLTAHHVPAGDVWFGGVTYPWVPGSAIRLSNGDTTYADLQMFLISPQPPLPSLSIPIDPPAIGTQLILIGRGRNRGAATSWDPYPGPPPSAIDGYLWSPGVAMRWGTNFLEVSSYYEPDLSTQVLGSYFDEADSAHEAQAANGDSGGAAFAWNGSSYELAGILIAVGEYTNQPSETSLYGQPTLAADLSFYRDEIVQVIPEPEGGLWACIALVAALGRARSARRRRLATLRRVERGVGRPEAPDQED